MELETYLMAFRARWISIVLATGLGVVAAFGWTMVQAKRYTSTASSIITTGVSSDLGSALAGDSYAKSRVKSYLDIAKSRMVSNFVVGRLHLTENPDALINKITVTNPLDTAVLRVNAEGPTPEDARVLAETWVAGMTQAVTQIENGGNASHQSIVQLRTLDSATLPEAPSFPNTQLSLAIGALAGLISGLGLAIFMYNKDKRIRSTKSLEVGYSLPVIGSIPFSKSSTLGVSDTTDSRINAKNKNQGDAQAFDEAMRKLRTNLQFMNIDNPPRVIVITSSLPGEGKSVIAMNLASSLAASGTRVVLVDADLRRPTLIHKLGLVDGAGLTDVLVGRAKRADVLQSVGRTGNLQVMGPGSLPPNPSELLGSDTMQNLLNELSQVAMVIIDAPPLLPVTDAVILTARTDGAIVVARAGETKTDQLSSALEHISRIGGKSLGLVLNSIPLRGLSGQDYGYQYQGYYKVKDTPKFAKQKPNRAS